MSEFVEVIHRRDKPVHIVVIVIVADGSPHPCLIDDDIAIGCSGKRAIAIVDKYLTCAIVRGHQQVTIPVAVDVTEVRCEAPIRNRLEESCCDAGLDARAGERAIAVVAPHGLGIFGRQGLRPPVAQEEIEKPIAIVVVERSTHRVF